MTSYKETFLLPFLFLLSVIVWDLGASQRQQNIFDNRNSYYPNGNFELYRFPNGSVDSSRFKNGTATNFQTHDSQVIKDLRENPDPNVNWLSPNPFSPQGQANQSDFYDSKYYGNSIHGSGQQQHQGQNKINQPFDNVRTNNQPQRPFGSNSGEVETFGGEGSREDRTNSFNRGFSNSNNQNVNRRDSSYPNANLVDYPGGQSSGNSFNSPDGNQRSANQNIPPGTYPGLDTGRGFSGGDSRNYPGGDSRNYPTGDSRNYPGGDSRNYPGGDSRNYPNYTGGDPRNPSNGRNYPGGDSRNYPDGRYPGSDRNYPGGGSDGNGRNYPGGGNVPNIPSTTYRNYQIPNVPYPGPVNPYPGGGTNFRGAAGFDPGYPNRNVWNELWTTTTYRPLAPGVLGRWRPDLQGTQRPEDINTVPTPVYVTTPFGKVQGFRVKVYDGPWVPLPARPGIASVDKVKATVSSFVGIPYARSPVMEGRFRPPRPHPGWQHLQAVEFAPACPQPARYFGNTAGIINVDEDCLYLNVFSPEIGSGVEGAPFPVLFYIHDGDFIHGASNQFPPHQLVAWYRLVVVTVNFRLGALGFLSTADEYSPGNYGMLDLAMALKWVHANIRAFNGDPERITLVGSGSGAGAAGLLMLSPKTRDLVKNVVALEGAPTADWAAIVDKYRLQNTTQLYSYKLGCFQEFDSTSWKLVQCLRTRSWQELANLELDPDVGTFPWSPAVDYTFPVPKDDYLNNWKEEDWHFLPDSPANLLKAGEYPYVKYMTGFSRQSAADLLYENKTLAPEFTITRQWFDEMIHLWVKKYNYTLNPEGVFSAIRYAYTYWPDPYNTTHLREEYINFLSDALYRSPVDETVKLLLARGIEVHSYLLNYTLEGLRLPEWREVPRGLDYYLLSGAPFMDPDFFPERLRIDRSAWTEGDRNMSNFFMSSVANLAHYGHPTPREVLGIFWERATPADLKYLSLNGTNNSTVQRNYHQRELTFWSEYMPFVVGRYVPTYPPTTEYWWEPNEPLQIAFWSVSGICLILIVSLVACCLLWRTAKKQRDRIYEDLGLSNGPIGLGTIVGDEMSEYAETVKTENSLDSGVKVGHHQYNPNPSSHHSMSMPLFSITSTRNSLFPQPSQHSAQSEALLQPQPLQQQQSLPAALNRDKFPVPKRSLGRETPQTQV